jgi:hypothetical protein
VCVLGEGGRGGESMGKHACRASPARALQLVLAVREARLSTVGAVPDC